MATAAGTNEGARKMGVREGIALVAMSACMPAGCAVELSTNLMTPGIHEEEISSSELAEAASVGCSVIPTVGLASEWAAPANPSEVAESVTARVRSTYAPELDLVAHVVVASSSRNSFGFLVPHALTGGIADLKIPLQQALVGMPKGEVVTLNVLVEGLAADGSEVAAAAPLTRTFVVDSFGRGASFESRREALAHTGQRAGYESESAFDGSVFVRVLGPDDGTPAVEAAGETAAREGVF